MDADLIKGLISLVTASIPLIIVILTSIRKRTDETKEPLDSSLLRLLFITRYPIEEKTWVRKRIYYSIKMLLLLASLAVFDFSLVGLVFFKTKIIAITISIIALTTLSLIAL